jgi:hypothetical protein
VAKEEEEKMKIVKRRKMKMINKKRIKKEKKRMMMKNLKYFSYEFLYSLCL